MKADIVRETAGTYITPAPDQTPIQNVQDILDLMSYSYEADSNKLLLTAAQLHPDFFQLETGFAGEIFLKLNNYRLQAAFVVDIASIQSKRFQELIYECNKGGDIRFVESVGEAEAWLLSLN